MLSFFYRLLSRFKTQDDITKDMHLTFEEARNDARARGWWSYMIFAVREISGMFSLPERWWLRMAGWGLAGLVGGWVVSYFLPLRYTSEATLHLVAGDIVNVEGWLETHAPAVLSDNAITLIVRNLNLYPNSRQRHPMADIVEEFRNSVRIERSGADLIQVVFTYGDAPSGETSRFRTEKVVQDLVGRMIAENLTQRSLVAAGTSRDFGLGRQGQLRLVNAASLPDRPDRPRSAIWLNGLGCGLTAGVLAGLWRALRRTPPPDFGAPSAEPA